MSTVRPQRISLADLAKELGFNDPPPRPRSKPKPPRPEPRRHPVPLPSAGRGMAAAVERGPLYVRGVGDVPYSVYASLRFDLDAPTLVAQLRQLGYIETEVSG